MSHLTDTQKTEIAAKLGMGVGKIDWSKILQLVAFLIQLLASPTPQPNPAMKAAVKDAGCPDEDNEQCCKCLHAAHLALESAKVSLECCSDCCTPV